MLLWRSTLSCPGSQKAYGSVPGGETSMRRSEGCRALRRLEQQLTDIVNERETNPPMFLAPTFRALFFRIVVSHPGLDLV